MNSYIFTNENIDKASEDIGGFLSSINVEQRESISIKLYFEEVLLEYQKRLGMDNAFSLKFQTRLGTSKIELTVPGESYDPFSNDSEAAFSMRLLSGIGLVPSWSYKNGKNCLILIPRKRTVSVTAKMGIAAVLAVITGLILNLLPSTISQGVNEFLLKPFTDAFTGLITAVAGPMIFLSILSGICSMGSLEALGKIGGKTLSSLLKAIVLLSLLSIIVSIPFFDITMGGRSSSNFSQLLQLIYDIIPANLFEPFITGNALQIIFISVIVGLSMLVLSSKVNDILKLINQLASIVQTIMTGISALLPFAIYSIFAGIISNGNIPMILDSIKPLLLMLFILFSCRLATLLATSLQIKISPILLMKKIFPTYLIGLVTASSAAALSSNIEVSIKKLGINKKLVEFTAPLGQVFFKPGSAIICIALCLCFSESYGNQITPAWLASLLLTSMLVSFSVPPVPGASIVGLTIAYTQLGIPMEVIGLTMAINTLTDFSSTATNVSCWLLCQINIARKLGMLDESVLRKRD